MADVASEAVTVDDIEKVDTYAHYFASPFDPTLNFDTSPSTLYEGDRYCEGEGVNGSWDELKVRNIDQSHNHRESSIQSTKDGLNLIFIDGELHLKLDEEPRIRFAVFESEVLVTILDGGYSRPPKGGFFKVSRYDDCLEHVATYYPDLPVYQGVKDITVYDATSFRFDDEEDSLQNTGWDTYGKLARYGNLLNQDDDVRRLFFKLGEMNISRLDEEGREMLCNHLDDLTKLNIGVFGLDVEDIKSAVERWRIRPVERKPSF